MSEKKEVKKGFDVDKKIIMPAEKVKYQNGDLIITDRRIIKHGTGLMSKFQEIFSEEYQDMDIKKIVSVKIEERLNMGFVKVGMIILVLVPLILILGQIDFFVSRFDYFDYFSTKFSVTLLFFSMLFFVFSFVYKRKVLSIFGEGMAKMDFHSYEHKDLLAIRMYQLGSKY